MLEREFLNPLRIGAAAVCGLALLEGALFHAAGLPADPRAFALSLGLGLAAAVIWWAGLSVFKRLSGHPGDPARVTSLAVALGLLYLILADWFAASVFVEVRRLVLGLALAALLCLVIALARMLYVFFPARGPDLAKARFQALTPVAVIAAALYSFAKARFAGENFDLAVFVVVLFLAAAQYAGIRMIWGGRREKWRRAGLRIQYLFLAAAPILAVGLLARHRLQAPGQNPDAPPLILITVDALRAGSVHALNPNAAPTPAMDRLAADGIVFEHAMAASSWTIPSLASMMSGLPPTETGAGRNAEGDHLGPYPSVPLIAETLRHGGYATASRLENPWLEGRNFDRGFDDYQEGFSSRRPRFLLERGLGTLARRMRPLEKNAVGFTDLVLDWMRHRPRRPFFLWLHYLDPHLPYENHLGATRLAPSADARWLAKSILAWHLNGWQLQISPADRRWFTEVYSGEVRFTDIQLGRLLDSLRARGLYDSSVIVLTADHGEELFDHGGFEHGHSFFDEVVHVPLIVKLPKNRHAGARVSEWVSLTRLAATLADAAGLPKSRHGASLLPCLAPGGCPDPGPVAWLAMTPIYSGHFAARGSRDGIKIITRTNGEQICFDLNFDPDELLPLPLSACPSTPLVRALAARPPPGAAPVPDAAEMPSEENRRRLRALGYVQ